MLDRAGLRLLATALSGRGAVQVSLRAQKLPWRLHSGFA